ncbi:hypothetical protein ABI59_08815 [Acidobacteria bacterium Mor1]|nr:hypothetical protein ABI59_08815 [Acidobacteria bacterium Mor1]
MPTACDLDDIGGSPDSPEPQVCAGYPDWETSDYVLPYDIGRAHRVSQGNCTNASHQRTLSYSYDLEMPFGSTVTAARAGMVYAMRMTQPAGSRGLTASNWLQVQHDDGSIAHYVHLAQFGNLVEVGDFVDAGDPLAITGDTGDVGDYPHLHFDVTPCDSNLLCNTVPMTFRNTTPNPDGLQWDVIYEAFPY